MIKQQMTKKIYTYEMLLWASPMVPSKDSLFTVTYVENFRII